MNNTQNRITGRARVTAARTALLAAPFTVASLASAQGAGPTFDTTNLESTATAVLGVGALIAIGFAVYKIGKRAMGKL